MNIYLTTISGLGGGMKLMEKARTDNQIQFYEKNAPHAYAELICWTHSACKKALLFKIKVIEPEWISISHLQPTPLFKPAQLPKKIFSIRLHRACPTNGSDCGSLRSHNLTLFVIRACQIISFRKSIISCFVPISFNFVTAF